MYFEYKGKAGVECPSNPWRVQNNAVFARMDAFLERCHDVLDLTQTIAQFQKVRERARPLPKLRRFVYIETCYVFMVMMTALTIYHGNRSLVSREAQSCVDLVKRMP